ICPKLPQGICWCIKNGYNCSRNGFSRRLQIMTSMVQAPLDMVESLADLHLPARTDRRLQILMDRNNEGQLTSEEQEDLAALVELSETISLLRARALRVLGRISQ